MSTEVAWKEKMNLEEDTEATRDHCRISAQRVHDQMVSVRDLIVTSRLNKYLIDKSHGHWVQIVSSMDVIEDTAQAIIAYCSTSVDEDNKSLLYLVIYGLFQVLFVQQDAAWNLCEALGVKDTRKSRNPILDEIRSIRNKAIGHPTKRGKEKEKSSHYGLVRVELSMEKITLWLSEPEKSYDHEHYFPFSLVDQQSMAILEVLSDVTHFLETLRKEIENSNAG